MNNTLWNLAVAAAFVFAVFGLTYTPSPATSISNGFAPLSDEQRHIADVCLGLADAERQQPDATALCRFIAD